MYDCSVIACHDDMNKVQALALEALEKFRMSLEICPDDHMLLLNMAIIYDRVWAAIVHLYEQINMIHSCR